MKISNKDQGAFISQIRLHALNSRLFYIIVGLFLTALQTGFVISEELSNIYLSFEDNPTKRTRTIMSQDSVFNKISGLFDVRMWLRNRTTNVTLGIFTLVAAVAVAIAECGLRFDLVSKVLGRKGRSFGMYVISGIVLNYDFFFFLFNLMAVNGITCRTIYIEEVATNDNNYIEETGFSSEDFFNSFTRYTIKKMIPIQVTSINNNILCLGANHFLLITLSLGIICGNIAIKLISSRIIRLNPSKDMFLSKYGNSDFAQDFLIVVIILTNSLIVDYAAENYLIYRIMFYSYLVLLGIAFSLNYIFRPFFNIFQHNLRSFQLLYLLLLTFSSIIARETTLPVMRDETSTIMFISLALVILLKINMNLSRRNKSKIFAEIMKLKKLDEGKIIQIYYLILEFIDKELENDAVEMGSKKNGLEQEIQLFTTFFLKEHRKKCNKLDCFCKGGRLFKFRHKLSYFNENLVKWGNMEVLLLLEKLLENAFIMSNRENKEVFYCYLYLQINYLGKAYEAYYLLLSVIESRRGTLMDLTIEEAAIMDEIENATNDNLKFGYLCLRRFPELINENTTQSKSISFAPHISFLNKFKEFKALVAKVVEERTLFLKELQASGNLERMFEFSTVFYFLSQKVIYCYKKLDIITDGDFSPLLLIYSWFMHSIYQNKMVASKVMSEYTRKYHKHNLNKIFGAGDSYRAEFSCIYVGLHKKSRHVIKYCTSNILSKLGFTFSELENKDLGIIIPQPVRAFHSRFFDDFQFGRKRFMRSEALEVYPIDRNGELIPCNLSLRYNSSIASGLQIVGILEFPQTKGFEKLALMDKNGTLTALMGTLNPIFSPNSLLQSYNKDLASLLKSLNSVVKEKLAKEERQFDYEYLFLGDKFQDWTAYYELKKTREVNLHTKEGCIKKVCLSIDEMLVYSLMEHFYVINVQETGGVAVFERATRDGADHHSIKKNIFEILTEREVQEKLNLKSARLPEVEYISEESVPEEIENKINDTRVFIGPKVDINLETNKILGNEEIRIKRISSMQESQHSQARDSSLFYSKKSGNLQESNLSRVHPIPVSKKRRGRPQGTRVDKLRKMSAMRDVLSKKIMKAKDKKLHQSHKSSGSSISYYSIKDMTLERVIHEHINPRRLHISTVLVTLMILLLCGINIESVDIKIPIQQQTNSDLKEQLIVADVFSWEIWGQVYPVMFLDIKRAAKEGKIPIDIGIDYGHPDIIVRADRKFQQASAYQYEPERTIDKKVRNLSFPHLFNYNNWVGTEVDVHFYESNKETNETVWRIERLHRKIAVGVMNAFAINFTKRNYSALQGQDGFIPNIGEDRNADPDEEFYRRNLNGNFNREYYLRSLDFYEYLKNVGKQNENYVLLTMLGTLIVTLVLFFSFVIYTIIDLVSMRRFYSSIFAIHVNTSSNL